MTTPLEAMRAKGPRFILSSPQARALGIALTSLDLAEATLTVPYRSDLVGDPESGVIAGGVVTTLLDHTCGLAVQAALGAWSELATLDLRIDYTRGAEPGRDLHAHAHCYRLTRSAAFVRASAYDDNRDDPVATAQAVFMLTGRRGARVKPAGLEAGQ